MTTQEMIDWAFTQDIPASQKLVLLALAYVAGPEGGGKITLERLGHFSRLTGKGCRTNLDRLASRDLVIYQIADDAVTFGIIIAERAS